MNILKSIDARKKNYYLKNYEKTTYGKNLLTLKNKYKGKRCFIIGNGPSLKAKDLDRLKDEYTFAFNRIYYMFDQTDWRPTFYCTQDIKIAQSSWKEIEDNIKTPYIFAPINLNWYYDVKLNTKYYFNQKQTEKETDLPFFSEDIVKEIGVGNTVAYTAMQIAVYMGFTEIYLLGIDHNFKVSQDRDGNVIVDNTVKDYFCDKYNEDKENLFIPKLDVSTLAYVSARQYIDHHPNVKIYNATRGGKLEVFERIEFDSIEKLGELV